MKRVCISLAAALALAVPSFAQSAEETPFSCEVRTKYNQPGTSYSSLAEAVAAYTWNDNTQSDWAEASEHIAISGGTFSEKPDNAWFADGFIPVENEDGTFGVAPGSFSAEIAGVKYLTLKEAFDAATEGQTVTLIADVDCSDTGVKVAKTVTFDLNGHTLSLANIGTGNLNIGSGATLTLKDSTDAEKKGTGSGKIVATHDYASGYGYGIINVSDGAAFVMESGLIDTVREGPVSKGQFGVMVSKTAKATINGGHIRAGWYAVAGNGNDATAPGTTIIVNGGILESTADYAIYHPQAGTLTIAGGTVAGAAGGLSINRGSATITGGTVTSEGTGDTGTWPDGTSGQGNAAITVGAKYGDVALAISGDAVITAPDGIPAISVPESDKAQAIAISGGTFSQKPDDALLAPDFVLVENNDGTYGVASAYVASIGDVKYADFNSFFTAFQAIAASETPTTVTLLADLTGDRAVPGVVPVLAGRNIVFDLNGHTMETALQQGSSTKHYYAIENSGTLTIKDSSTEQTGTIRARGVENLGNGKLTIESGTIVSVDANGGACIWNEADVTVKGGTFTTEFVGTPSDEFGPGCLNNSGTALVTGGTFHNVNRRTYAIISNTGSIEITPAEGSEVTVFGAHGGLAVDGGTAVVNGGTYSSSDFYGLYVSNDGLGADPMQAAVTVNGGTFDGKSYSVLVGSDYNDPVNSTIAIKGGTFLKPLHRQEVSRPDAIQVSGGTFSEKPDNAWFVDGFIPVENEDGTFGVAPGSFSAEIAGVKYLTLQEAFDAATERQTVTLIADVDCSDTGVKVGKTVTFDLNGRTLSLANIGTGNLNIAAGATLTLVDSTDTEKKGTGAGKIVATHDYASGYGYGIINVSDGAAFVMESGLIDTVREDPVNKGQFGVMVSKTGKATINGGHIRAGWYAIAGNGNDNVEPGTTIVVNGGILESTADYAIYHPQAGTLSIAGGTVAGAAGGLSINRGSATITGGTVTSQGTGDTGDWGDGTSGQGNAAITVGAEYGDVALAISGEAVITAPEDVPAISVPESDKAQDIAISGGTFSEKPDNAWFADGFIPVENEDGTFGVAPGSFAAEIAGEKYLTLTEAVAAGNGKTIKLLTDATDVGNLNALDGTRLTIDLNGHNITFAASRYFQVMGGSLHLTGKGRVEESVPNWGAIMVWGAKEDVADYSTVVVDEDVTLEGWAPLFINNNAGCAYGVKVKMAGTANSVKDIAGAGGHGVYINGAIKKIEGNVPQITLTETSKVTSLGNGIYAAGYAHWTLAGDVSGADALSIKSGTFTITGGDYRGTGSFADPADANGNGSENTGAAVTITTNDGYAKAPIVVNITGGDFTSENGYAFYEGIAKKADGTPAATASRAVIAIKGGTFTGSKTNEDVTADIAVTTAENKQVVSGGTFSKPVALAYCAPGYIPEGNAETGTYGVTGGTYVAAIETAEGVAGYEALQEAIAAVPENGAEATTIMLLDDVTSADSLTFTNGQKAILNMNGKTVTFTSGKLQLQTATSLTLTGEGSLVCQTPSKGAISIYGNETSQIDLLVDSGVTVDGHYGIALFGDASTACRNVTVTVKGTVKTSEGGSALYVNGTVNDLEGPVPQITLAEGATVEAASVGIYAAGYAKWDLAGTINAAYAITIKSGDFNITGGSYNSTGEFKDPSEANSNGTENTGAAISITTNPDYAQKTNVTITGGTFTSANGYAFYEGIAVKDGQPIAEASSAVIAIKGGDFTGSKTNEAVTADIAVTTAENKQVVSGGTFSKPVALAYCAPGYIPVVGTEGKYTVDNKAVAAVANPAAPGAYLGYDTLAALVGEAANGTEVLIVNSEALGEEDANLLKTATGGDNAASGAAAYEVAETLGGTFKVQDGAIVYAYQLGIADVRASGSSITVVVRLEEGGAAVSRTLAGRKVRVVSGETLLAEADAFFEEGDVTLEFTNDADVLEFAIEVLSEAEAETPAE